MRPLTASDMLLIWERGQAQVPLVRGLTALAVAEPGWSPEQLSALSLGQRDSLLFALRRQTFGPLLNGYSECPKCGQRVEFDFDTTVVLAQAQPLHTGPDDFPEQEEAWTLEAAGYRLRCRLPDSRDLVACATCPDVETARQILLERCVLEIEPSGAVADLPQEALEQLAQELASRDPLAEVAFELSCPVCATRWHVELDIGSYLWAEIDHQAKRLVREVGALARAYGWSERDILALSAARRRAYLELET